MLRTVAVAIFEATAAACGARSPAAPSSSPTPMPTVAIMGPARLTAGQLTAWFNGRQPRPPGSFAATEPVEALASYFIEEGMAEGVKIGRASCRERVEMWVGEGG